MRRSHSHRAGQALLLGLLLACGALPGEGVRAQIGPIQPPEAVPAEARINAFVPWGGSRPSHGLTLDLPAGWRLVEAVAVHARTNEQVPLRLAASSQHERRVHALTPRALRGPLRFVLGLEVGPEARSAEVTVYPLGRREDGQLIYWSGWEARWRVAVEEAPPARGLALRGDGRAVPLVLDRRALPPLGDRDGYTVEAWLKTTGLEEVVLSAWDGREGQPYPFEWLVDAQGRLVVYRGEPGRHVGMTAEPPVADGRWHHVALTHDPAGWTRLFVDGAAADSLRSGDAAGDAPLAVGGRHAARGASTAAPYTGLLDELRVWDRARGRDEIGHTLRRRLDEPVEGLVRLGFEEDVPARLVVARAERLTAPSDLAFVYPVEALAARVDGRAVRLTWETKDRESEAFAVERSLDGRAFAAVGEVRLRDRVAEAADGTMRFAYTDLPPEAPLLYYRIRQRAADGPDRLSGALKLGLGADGGPLAELLGNSPNPFATSTAVLFALGQATPVRLSVWDVAGARVAVLYDGPLGAGRHEVVWDAGDLPSGVYFVQLQTPETRLTHKVTLAR
ncbi:MAG TPA: LamG-like jellyroll fold domain-containing protein [Rubricoccaceae bacterium]|nr:LamG-like jellyroll fold domain-containing protein [Rubricoccaceae bacterium]